MVDLFGARAVLFESDQDEERVRIECAVTEDGGLAILQESDGPLTRWCFEESPHRVETEVGPRAALDLLDYFHLDEASQLPAVLRVQYFGYDCGMRIRSLLRHLEVPYQIFENVPAR